MVTWRTLDVIPFRRAGKWILGAIVQEDDTGKRRIKVFKGRIKEDGRYSVRYKGQELRFSLVQRINIPSVKYWEALRTHIDNVVRMYLSGEHREKEGLREATLFDFE